MKALMLMGLNRLELVETDIPAISDDQILIKTRHATICTSDLVDIEHNHFGIDFPMVIGHEGAGKVVAVGKAVSGFRIGQPVATHPVHPCLQCQACRAGYGHLCPNMRHFGLNMPGTFAEYYVARADRVRAIPDRVDTAPFCLAEPLAVCLQALNQANLKPGGNLAIMGDGPFGVIMARLAAYRDLRRVVLAGWSDFRLGFAGPTTTINTRSCTNAAKTLVELNEGNGYDAVILAVASQQALDDALGCLRLKGRLVVFAALRAEVRVDMHSVHMKEFEIVGACNDEDLFDMAVQCLTDWHWSDIITHRFPVESYVEAFTLARTGHDSALKIAFEF